MRIKKGLVTLSISVMITLTAGQTFATPADALREVNQQLQSTRSEVNVANQEILQIIEKVNKAEEELHKASEELEELNEEIVLNEENLEAAEKNLAEKTDEFNSRLRKMYMDGNSGYLEVLLSSQDFSDLLSRNHMLQQIASYDKELIIFIKEHRDFIEEKNNELESQRASLEEVKDEIETRKAGLERANEEKQALVARLEMDIATFESRYNQLRNTSRPAASSGNASRGNTSRGNGAGGNTATSANSTTANGTPTKTESPVQASNGSLGSQIANTAMKFRGSRYVYGGTSPSGFDCSGFTSYVYRQFGISIPRTSGGQASVGRSVSRAEAQPGDILAFPGHVGIYIGNGNMIHASNPTRGVVVDKVFSGYYSSRLLSIRRAY